MPNSEDSFNLLKEVIALTNVGYCIVDLANNRYESVSEEYALIFGYTPEKFMARFQNLDDDIKLVHPDDRTMVTDTYALGGEVDLEYRIVHLDGSVRIVHEASKDIFDSNGTPIRALTALQDITDSQKAEKELQNNAILAKHALRIADLGYCIYDNVATQYISISEDYASIFGQTVEEFMSRFQKHEDDMTLVHPDDREKVSQEYREYYKSGKTSDIIYRIFHADGSVRIVREVCEDVIDENGARNSSLSILQDITESRQAQEALRERDERLRTEAELLNIRKLESVGVLAGGIAHDFNNILAGLFGNIELAKLNLTPSDEAFPYIEKAFKSLDRATSLTQQLLTFARGGDPLLESLNIMPVVEETGAFTLSGSNVRMSLSFPDNLWNVVADKGQLSQVITNLIMNADQAMPDGGKIVVQAQNVEAGQHHSTQQLSGPAVELIIRDEGVGISQEHTEKIFDPYFTTKQSGSGLGLAMAYSIISKHGGYIGVESTIGVGTTFSISLPAEIQPEKSNPTRPVSRAAKSKMVAQRILVMDDDETIRQLLEDMLGSLGYLADSAADGMEVIEKNNTANQDGKPYDLVIMDLTIPGGMGGKEAVERLLVTNPQVKAIVASGYSTDPVMANYGEHGFKGRLSKPFKLTELEDEVERVIVESQ